jgi:hypothetical protein
MKKRMSNREIVSKPMRQLSAAENARRDAEAERDFEAGKGIPAGEVFAWLHDRIDGGQTPVPKARKIS